MPQHLVVTAERGRPGLPAVLARGSQGLTRQVFVDQDVSVHTTFAQCELAGGGHVPWHLHAFEESIFVLDGEVVCESGDGALLLRAGDYGMFPVGFPHALRNVGSAPARWAQMLAPQERPGHPSDTLLVEPPVTAAGDPVSVDPRDPRTRSFGHIEPHNMEVDRQTQADLAMSASMRTALLVYSGITVKMMVDSDLGAFLSTMFMVHYEPGGFAGAHDHPFEETYLILDGEVDAVFDGTPYHLVAGDVAFAGVGCTHEFSNAADGPVRWLETQAPQPPARHSYRFARDWDYLTDKLSNVGKGS